MIGRMRIAYLTNQYPKISHTFIRREIEALIKAEKTLEIFRFSIRPTPDTLLDPADIAEESTTEVVLEHGSLGLLVAMLIVLVCRPIRLITSFMLAMRLSWRAERGCLWHLIYLAEAAWLLLRFKRDGVTHVHVHFGTNPATVALLCHALGGPSFSFTVHGPEEFDHPEALQLRIKIERCQFVVAVSSFGRSQLYRWAPIRHWSRIKVVRCGLPAECFDEELHPLTEAPRLVCIGRLCEQKGQLLLVEAARILRDSGIKFEVILVGDGEMRNEIENLVASTNLTECVKLVGWQSSAQVRNWLINSRAFVLPSFAEGLPVSIMEAFAAGRPVVSTYIAGIPELVRAGANGWLIPAGCTEELAAALNEVLHAQTNELTRMGENGRRLVQEFHNADVEAARLAKLFLNCQSEAA